MPFVYEPQYRIIGWAEDCGKVIISWFDRDLTDSAVGMPFFVNTNAFFTTSQSYTLPATTAINQNVIFIPAVRMLTAQVHEVLKNEIRRTKILRGPGSQT